MNPTKISTRKTRLTVVAAAFVFAACCAVLATSAWLEAELRRADLKNAETDVSNMARSLMQHAEDTLEISDATLISLVGRLEQGGTAAPGIESVQSFFNFRRASLGRIRGLFVYDAEGRWLATTEQLDKTGLNNSDRRYFAYHREHDDGQAFLGDPVRSRSGGQWAITLSRRFNNSDGSFGGVVLATVDVDYFVRFYGEYDLGPRGSVALLDSKGTLLARSRDDGKLVGRDMSGTPLFRKHLKMARSAVYYFTSPIDGMQRISAYRASERFPLVLLATETEIDVLDRRRDGVAFRSAVVFLMVIALGITGFFLVKQLGSRHRMAAALAAKEADFRLLAEGSSDMVTRIALDETLLYVSPSASNVVGWNADQLVGTPSLAGVHPEDIGRVRGSVLQLRVGAATEGRILYRTRHRSRGYIWLESSLRVTRDATDGTVGGVVAITRDMTEQKDLQTKLTELAAIDGLTGLANRRCFDEALETAWAASLAEATPLSLIMIDVDRFKLFNDHYGHQAGDICLRAIAQALSAVITRPEDLVARYGGEEFIVMLPKTDGPRCKAIAHALRQAVLDLQIPHEYNQPEDWVTISAGGISNIPTAGLSKTAMMKSADAALFVAKRAGRNRLYMAPAHVAS